MIEPIAAHYEWNAETMAEALIVHRKASLGRRGRVVLTIFLMIMGLVTIIVVASAAREFKDGPPGRQSVAIPGLFWIFGTWLFLYFVLWSKGTQRRIARNSFKSMPGGARLVEWTIDDDRLANRTDLTASTLLWPTFIRVVESPWGFLLYQSKNFFNALPAVGFASADELRRFAELARGKVADYVVVGECRFPAKPEPFAADEVGT